MQIRELLSNRPHHVLSCYYCVMHEDSRTWTTYMDACKLSVKDCGNKEMVMRKKVEGCGLGKLQLRKMLRTIEYAIKNNGKIR